MKYKVVLRGMRDLEVDKTPEIETIKSAWVKYKNATGSRRRELNEVARIDNTTFPLSSIAGFESIESRRSEKKSYDFSREAQEYSNWHERERSRPLDEKAKRTWVFEILYFAHKGEFPNQDKKKKAIKYQTKWLQANPQRIHPDPTIFRGKIGIAHDDSETAKKVRSATMKMVERMVAEDIAQARKVGWKPDIKKANARN